MDRDYISVSAPRLPPPDHTHIHARAHTHSPPSSAVDGECSCKPKIFTSIDIADNRKNRETALRNLADRRTFLKRLLPRRRASRAGNSEDEIETAAPHELQHIPFDVSCFPKVSALTENKNRRGTRRHAVDILN